jgi:superfamily II DNA or RNA helicase
MLTRRGYAIAKEGLSADKVSKIMKELNVAPAVPMQAKRFGSPPTFRIFAESLTQYYLPRVWATEVFGPATKTTLTSGEPLRSDLVFTGTPYDYQKQIVETFVAAGNGLICVPCGRGKTFMAIMIAAKLGHKFMIIVDKEFLLDQWMGELKSLLPGLRVGILQKDIKQIGEVERKALTIDELKVALKKAGLPVTGTRAVLLERLRAVVPEEPPVRYDCCIAMIQTLSQREFGHDEFQSFGLTIFDECHHLGAEHFSRALLKVQTKWMLGLSATPIRDDGLTKVFEWFIGKPVYWEKMREADPDVIVQRVGFSSDDPAYAEVPVDARGDPVLPTLLTHVVACEERNLLIDGILRKVLEEPRRKILVLSDRKEHLHRINANLPPGTSSSYYIGGMDSETRQNGAATARVLLGTYAMASEAMNVKTLNTMIMVSPRKKVEQSTGRILRTQKDARDIPPLIIDLVDAHGVYQGQWGKRKAYYKKCAYKIQDVVGDYALPSAGPTIAAKVQQVQKEEVSISSKYMFED